MSDNEWDPANMLEVFGDQLSRQILILASESAISATTLADHLDVTPPTIYRRTDELTDYGFIRERQVVADDGHHYRIFETTVDEVRLEIDDGGYNVDIQMRQDLKSQFETFWNDLSEETPTSKSGSIEDDKTTNAGNDPAPR